ncbi:hypothetical protein [Dactylosporangium sp. NPDC050588]|uniref:hypothetical protein n=1 Tax=Dactylosporangium sp. NPDC050588 TaxID=3157211 RepID=UPI0033D395EC
MDSMNSPLQGKTKHGVPPTGGETGATRPGLRAVEEPHDGDVRAMLLQAVQTLDGARLRAMDTTDTGRVRIRADLTGVAVPTGALEQVVARIGLQHLAKLRDAGLVASCRDGTRIYYRAATSHLVDLLNQLVVVGGYVSGELDLPRPGAPAPTAAATAATRNAAASRSRPAGGRARTAET